MKLVGEARYRNAESYVIPIIYEGFASGRVTRTGGLMVGFTL